MLFATTAWAAAEAPRFGGDVMAMIADADGVVKFIMTILVIFSVWSWALIVHKGIMLKRAKQNGAAILKNIGRCETLAEISNHVKATGKGPMIAIFDASHAEIARTSGGKTQVAAQALVENVSSRIDYATRREMERLGQGLGFMASAGNASPFIGLFGTVWGIMASFREIGVVGSANLATVAPGISEALIATAMGLFVAIPAVLFYNRYTVRLDQINAQLELFKIELVNWLRRGAVCADR